MLIKRVPLSLILGLAMLSAGCGGAETPRHVVLITLDTTRPDFFGAWGCAGDPTPHFDALAREGIRFSTAVSASALTPVSHASILTGRTPYGHGLRVLAGDGGFRLPDSVPTLASALKQRGYATAAIHSAFPVSRTFGFERDFDLFQDVAADGLEESDEGWVKWSVDQGQRRSDATNALVFDFLDMVEGPFFLWIHYWDPHDNYFLPPQEFLRERGLQLAANGQPIDARARYSAEISYVDLQFGLLVDKLKSRGLYDDTLVAVVADHGEGLDDGLKRHGWAAHRILYQEQMHVPLILRIPGAASGKTVDKLVRTVDIFPTMLDYLDIAPPDVIEGRSLKTLIEGQPDEPRLAYADQINLWDANAKMVEQRPQSDLIHVLMDDEWKFIYRPSYPRLSELYAYREDPLESKNLLTERQEVSVRMMQELARRGGWVLAPPSGDGRGMSSRSMKTLASLGYTAGGVSISPEELADMWEWLCPVEWRRWPNQGPCPECGSACLPVRKKQ